MVDKMRADDGAAAGQKVQNAGWYTRYFKNFKCGELKATALQDFRRAFEQPRTLFKRRPAPFAKRCARSLDGALRFGNSCFASVTDNLIRSTGIHRGRQLIGPNLFATNDKWILFAEAFSHFAQCALHFVLAIFVNEIHKW